MPTTNIWNEQVTWEWRHQFSGNQNSPQGAFDTMRQGKPPVVTRLPLVVLAGGNTVRLHSRGIKLAAHVEVSNEGKIPKFGFSNTIYRSSRRWQYSDAVCLMEEVSPVPSWDGSGDDEAPWYGAPFEFADDDHEAYFDDAPNLPPYPDDASALPYGALYLTLPQRRLRSPLLFIEGIDLYETLLLVQNDDDEFHILDSVCWRVNFEAVIEDGQVLPTARSGTFFVGAIGHPQQLVLAGPGSADRKVDKKLRRSERDVIIF